MRERFYTIGLWSIALGASGACISILAVTNPTTATPIVLGAIGIFGSIACGAFCAMFCDYIYALVRRTDVHEGQKGVRLCGALCSVSVFFLLTLQWTGFFTWWTAAMAVSGVIVLFGTIILLQQPSTPRSRY